MALVTAKNSNLYRAWIQYLCQQEGRKQSTAEIRATAFFKSQAATPVPVVGLEKR